MKVVGDQLEKWALEQKEGDQADLFGRSAFNRYYYAAFLITREMLGQFEQKWEKTPHKKIPELLTNTLKKSVDESVRGSFKAGVITESQKSKILSSNNESLCNLATILDEAYRVRIIADYEPEVRITQNQKVIALDNHTLTTAKTWAAKANAYCKVIRKAREDAGLA